MTDTPLAGASALVPGSGSESGPESGAVHFMGVGGVGMCALAELFVRRGRSVTGCDLRPGASTERLRSMGVRVDEGHDSAHVQDANSVVVTAAVPEDHPELAAARDRGIPILKRAAALGAVVNEGTVLAVAGTHGKTTTTAIAAELLVAGGMDPTGFVGGAVRSWGGNLRVGGSDLFVVEADEFDRSFHSLHPSVAVVTNVEADHLDTYGSFEALMQAFEIFVSNVPSEGRVAVCGDDVEASRLLPALGTRGYSYGLSAGSQLRAVEVETVGSRTRFRAVEDGRDEGMIEIGIVGVHNLRNALGAAAASRALGVSWEAIRFGMDAFGGVSRRFEMLGEVRGVELIDDYAHHPTEVDATIAAARARFPGRRLVAAFQPHLYSRTRDFAHEFGIALAGADVVWVTDVFPAREAAIPGVTGELIADEARQAGAEVHYHAELESLADSLAGHAQEGDVLLTLGAGSIESIAPEVARRLGEPAHA